MGIVCSQKDFSRPGSTFSTVVRNNNNNSINITKMGDNENDNSEIRRYKVHFKHPRFGSISIYDMELDSNRTIGDLKDDLAQKFNLEGNQQQWMLRSVVLENNSTLGIADVGENDVIEVSVVYVAH